MPVERDCGVAQRMLTDTTPGWRQLLAAYHTPTGLNLLVHTIVSHSLLIFPITIKYHTIRVSDAKICDHAHFF
jgi:hypothetical protein